MWILLVPLASDATPVVQWADTGDRALTLTEEAAKSLASTCNDIASTGRIHALPALRTDAETLVRRAEALERFTQEPIAP